MNTRFSLFKAFHYLKWDNEIVVRSMIGKLLKIIRTDKGLKQSELAEKLNIAQTTLSGYETNYSNPRFEIIEEFANNCDYEIIFRNKKTKEEITTKSIKRKEPSKN